MDSEKYDKVRLEHRSRNAYLYIRQSTLRQVLENSESTKRQYALRDRALALGWDAQQIVVIDSDLGQSGASATDREGFQKLVAEVGMGRAGIVLGLEVSRLARNCSDWHRLIEMCSLSHTLILDEDGVYDPRQFNDRLLLGLKGAMSEAELHVLQARMRGGILNKVDRGEFAIPLPVGFVYDVNGRVVVEPDQQVQQSIRQLFATYQRTGSVRRTVREFGNQRWKFPVRRRKGPQPSDLEWGELTCNRVNSVLRNPRYAGAYVYGQNQHHKKPDGSGRRIVRVPREQWRQLQRGAHPGYITWEEYEDNLKRLQQNAPGSARHRGGAPREGAALLQGLVHCGICGARMAVRYHCRVERLVPDYFCCANTGNHAAPACQVISGRVLDREVGKLLLGTITPQKLELAMAVQEEIDARQAERDCLNQARLERAKYDATLVERRYKAVDPENRLVARTLETDWNDKLRLVGEAEREYEQLRLTRQAITAQTREQILRLADDLPQIWLDDDIPNRERKRMVRILIEDVTLLRDAAQVAAHIRFKGGATETIRYSIRQRRNIAKLTPERNK
jgi:DNA invertase Pin-like site-specific DNA recombinase